VFKRENRRTAAALDPAAPPSTRLPASPARKAVVTGADTGTGRPSLLHPQRGSRRCRPSRPSATPKPITPPWPTNAPTGPDARRLNAISAATLGRRGYAAEELVADWSAFLCADLGLTWSRGRITPPTSRTGWGCCGDKGQSHRRRACAGGGLLQALQPRAEPDPQSTASASKPARR
jgi:hypothetical protein